MGRRLHALVPRALARARSRARERRPAGAPLGAGRAASARDRAASLRAAAIALCMSASPELRAPCLARLRVLRDERGAQAGGIEAAELLLNGAERYAA